MVFQQIMSAKKAGAKVAPQIGNVSQCRIVIIPLLTGLKQDRKEKVACFTGVISDKSQTIQKKKLTTGVTYLGTELKN